MSVPTAMEIEQVVREARQELFELVGKDYGPQCPSFDPSCITCQVYAQIVNAQVVDSTDAALDLADAALDLRETLVTAAQEYAKRVADIIPRLRAKEALK